MAVLVVDAVLDRGAVLARLDACRFMLDDQVSFVILWGGLNLYVRNWGARRAGRRVRLRSVADRPVRVPER